nr:CDP-diacylglycerol--glycerol-3-phosphate 3-phosphatidyltransferase [Limibaculum sp. NKW23]
MIWTVPNLLTMARIAAAPALALVVWLVDAPLAGRIALGLFLAAALTDFLDGWLARRLDQQSALGAMLDPVGDKAMVTVALIVLAATSPVADLLLLPGAVIVTREVLVSGLREHLAGAPLAVTRLAKWKTAAQMAAIGVLLAAEPLAALAGPPPAGGAGPWIDDLVEAAGIGLLWLAAALTLVTGWDYFRKAVAYISAKEER